MRLRALSPRQRASPVRIMKGSMDPVTTADVDAWTQAGREAGLSEKWLRDRLRYLASFYDFCETAGFDPAYSPQQHPVREAKKPKVKIHKDFNYLSRPEADALLRATFSLLEDVMFLKSGTPELVRNVDIAGELGKMAAQVELR